VWVLVRSSVVFGTCSDTWRYLCRSKQGARCAKLEVSQVSASDSSVPWSCWILSALYSWLLQNSSVDDQAALERCQVCMESELWRSFSSSEKISYHCSCSCSTRYWQAIWCVLWCLKDWTGMRAYAGWACDSLWFTLAEKARGELSDPWFRVGCCGARSKNLEALFVGKYSAYLYRSQESQVYFHSVRIEHEVTEMVGANQELQFRSSLSSWKS